MRGFGQLPSKPIREGGEGGTLLSRKRNGEDTPRCRRAGGGGLTRERGGGEGLTRAGGIGNDGGCRA